MQDNPFLQGASGTGANLLSPILGSSKTQGANKGKNIFLILGAMILTGGLFVTPIAEEVKKQASSMHSQDLEEFYQKYVGKAPGDENGGYPGQCVSLARRWTHFIGITPYYYNGDYPIPSYNNYKANVQSMIANNDRKYSSSFESVEEILPGDLIIIKYGTVTQAQLNGSASSHIAIAYSTFNITTDSFTVFESNWEARSTDYSANNKAKKSAYKKNNFYGGIRLVKKAGKAR
jgi:hypothetical protein